MITDLIEQARGVGDAVGSLGFADEVLALVACPIWGIISDRVGVRIVSSLFLNVSITLLKFNRSV